MIKHYSPWAIIQFFILFFNWRIIALQNFVVFCQTSHELAIGICIFPPFWTSLSSPSPSYPSRLIQSPCLSFLRHRASSHWLSILHMVKQVSMLLCPYISPPPPLSPWLKSVLYVGFCQTSIWISHRCTYVPCLGFLTARGWLLWYPLTNRLTPK